MTLPDPEDAPAGTWVRPEALVLPKPQRYASLAAAGLIFLGGLYTLREFLPALAWTAVFAIALWPSFERLATRWPQHRRGLLPGLIVLAILVVFALPAVVIAVPLANEAHQLGQWIGQARENGIAPPAVLGRLPEGARLTGLWQEYLGQPTQIKALTKGAIHGGGARLAGVLGRQTVHRLALFGVMLVGLFFCLRDSESVIAQLRAGSHRAFGEAGEDIGRQIINSVHGTVNGLVLVGLGEGLILCIAYVIAGVPDPTLFGLLTAVLAMVPFGAAVAIGAAVLVLVVQGAMAAGIAVAVFGALVTFIADHFIRPVLIGGSTKLPFLWVLLGILGGISAWGLIGLFLGPALMAALILLWREFIGAQKGPMNPTKADLESPVSRHQA